MKNSTSAKADPQVVLSQFLDKEREELIAHHASMRHWQLMGQLMGQLKGEAATRHPLREKPRLPMARSLQKTL